MHGLASRLAVIVALSVAPLALGCGGEDATAGEEQDAKAKVSGRIEIFIGEDAQWYFRVIANNNEKLLRSEGYTSRAAVEKGIESAKKNGLTASRYKLLESEDGEWLFNLVASNGEIIGTSETYTSKSNAERGLATLKKVFDKLSESAPVAKCGLTRLSSIPGGKESVVVDLGHLEQGYGGSDSLTAYEGSYSFDVTLEDGFLNVIFYENEHVQDEVGSMGCDMPSLKRGTVFCEEPITIDASLGTDSDEEKTVHAFDFACTVE